MQNYAKNIGLYLMIFIIIVLGLLAIRGTTEPVSAVIYNYGDLINDIKNNRLDKFKNIEITLDQDIPGAGRAAVVFSDNRAHIVEIPSVNVFMNVLSESGVTPEAMAKVITRPTPKTSWIMQLVPMIIITVISIFLLFFLLQQMQGGGGGNRVMSFGKSRARVTVDESKRITFAQVAGLGEEKQELEEIVEFLKQPKKFTDIGARIPKGVLLVGPPGTGKTYLAKAVSGEAGVPFFSISGSDFVEMFVGVGASRVRDLFEQAKKNNPCIVFIDEIDAVGRRRGAGLGGGHDEREQTLNQLLVEMDGFGLNEGVIIMAATNRPDILDPALLRPGRFDRRVVVGMPDVNDREQVLKIHAKTKQIADDVDFRVVAQTTSGLTPADLENLLNESALLSARHNKTKIDMEEIRRAFIKVSMGTEKKSRVISDKDRRITAYHEAGHAILFEVLEHMDPTYIVSIIPVGMAGGFTMPLPGEDRSHIAKQFLLESIIALYGGRAAETIVIKDITTGALNDIERATKTARNMVMKYGMSDALGPIQFGDDNEEVFIGRDLAHTRNYGDDMADSIDREIKTILNNCFNDAIRIINENIDVLHKIAELLLEREKLSGEEIRALFPEGTIKKTIRKSLLLDSDILGNGKSSGTDTVLA